MSLTSLLSTSNMLPLVFLHMRSTVFLGVSHPYFLPSERNLTVFKSIFPISGSVHCPNTDHLRRCANQRNSQLLSWYQNVTSSCFSSQLTFGTSVWGPEPFALGFIGAPLATAISFNLISIASIVYGVFFVPSTAWHPFSRRSFTSLGVLVRLGLGGIGLSPIGARIHPPLTPSCGL